MNKNRLRNEYNAYDKYYGFINETKRKRYLMPFCRFHNLVNPESQYPD